MTNTESAIVESVDSNVQPKRIVRKQSPHVQFSEAQAFRLLKRTNGACAVDLQTAMNRSAHMSAWSLRYFVERYASDHFLYKRTDLFPTQYFVLPKTEPTPDNAKRVQKLSVVRRQRARAALAA